MDSKHDQYSCSLSCELRIIKARNIDNIKSRGELFVRCYLTAGNNTRVKLESHKISSNSNFITWNQTFSLDCIGNDQSSIKWLKQETLVFELHSRSTTPFIGKISGSTLIGRGEVPWKGVFESENLEIEKWAFMIPQKNGRVHDDDVKPPAVQIGMKIIQESVIKRKKVKDEECCMDCGCNSCLDYELLAIGAALEDL